MELFGDDSLMTTAQNVAGILAGAVLLYVALVRFSPSFRSFSLVRPLRASRRSRRHVTKPTQRLVIKHVKAHARGRTTRPADLLADVLRELPEVPLPWDGWASNLRAWIRAANRPGMITIAVRIVAPEQGERVDSLLEGLQELLGRFGRVEPVASDVLRPPLDAGGEPHCATAHFASAISGAAVIVDAGAARGGAADSVLVWHDNRFRNGSADQGKIRGHGEHSPTLTWEDRSTYLANLAKLSSSRDYRLGDYNGRLLELTGVTLAANHHDGEVSFVLETRETSYEATEQTPIASKHLSSRAEDVRLPVFRSTGGSQHRRVLTTSEEHTSERALMVTAYVSILTTGELPNDIETYGIPGDWERNSGPIDFLVLCHRSAKTRNGKEALSATAGGVVEMDQATQQMDTDHLGSPSITRSVFRELNEELGLSPSSVTMAPVCTWVSTVRGPRRPDGAGTGQVVASVLMLGTTSVGLASLNEARFSSNHQRGGFEVDRLAALALLPGGRHAQTFAQAVRDVATILDQHGMLSCFYAAVRYYGAEAAIATFAEAFADDPWWAMPWRGETSVDDVRVCRDVRAMLPDEANGITGANPVWATHWSGLSQRLMDHSALGGQR